MPCYTIAVCSRQEAVSSQLLRTTKGFLLSRECSTVLQTAIIRKEYVACSSTKDEGWRTKGTHVRHKSFVFRPFASVCRIGLIDRLWDRRSHPKTRARRCGYRELRRRMADRRSCG